MDAAHVADASDVARNYHFRRRWDAPPLKVKAPPVGGTTRQGDLEVSSSKQDIARIFKRFKNLSEVAS